MTYCPEPERQDVSEMVDVADTPLVALAGPRQGQSVHHPQSEALPPSCCHCPMTAVVVLHDTDAACSSFLLLAAHAPLKPFRAEYHASSLVVAAVAASGVGGGQLPGMLHQSLTAQPLDVEALVAEVLLLGGSLHVKHGPDSAAAAGGGTGLAWEPAFHPD